MILDSDSFVKLVHRAVISSSKEAWYSTFPDIPYDQREIFFHLITDWKMSEHEAKRMLGIE